MASIEIMEKVAQGGVKEIKTLSVIIPAFNEEEGIVDSIKRFSSELKKFNLEMFEIIVVDDGSSDQTGKLSLELGTRVIRHPHNNGYGRSLKDGIRAAKYDTIVISDADGTYPIEEISKLFETFQKGFDMVVGARQGEHYHESWFKMPLRKIFRLLVEFAAGHEIPDINSGFRIFSRDEAGKHFNHLCDTFSFTTTLTLAYIMTGKFVGYIPIPYYKRIGKTRVRLFRDAFRTLQYIINAILYFNPIKIFLVFCEICLVISLLCFLVTLLMGLNIGYYLGIVGIFSSIIMFGLGLLAEQLRQIRMLD